MAHRVIHDQIPYPNGNTHPPHWECWNDKAVWDGPVYSLPVKVTGDEPCQVYHVVGAFCSLACAMRYMLDREFDNSHKDLFADYCITVHGQLPPETPAPPVSLLAGLHLGDHPLSITEYRIPTAVYHVTPVDHRVVFEDTLTTIMQTAKPPKHTTKRRRRS